MQTPAVKQRSLSSATHIGLESLGWAPALITAALLAGLALRFVWFTSPPYDSHAFRQTQTLATIEFYHTQGIDILHPKTIYVGYPGILVLELPIFQAFAALVYGVLGAHLEIVRIINILFGAGTTWFLYQAIGLLLDRRTAVLTALIYWLAPLNIVYQRSMLIEPMAVFCAMVCFYSLARQVAEDSSGLSLSPATPRRYGLWFVILAIACWLTAMIKALYLWPAVLLLIWAGSHRKLKPHLVFARIIAVFAFAGFSFLVWNHYAARVNDASPFTRGIQPTALLGLSPLVDPQYYFNMIVRRPKWWLGVLGVLLYPVGLWAAWSHRSERAPTAAFVLLALIPPTYLLGFSLINRPHDYYQLIITPFLAVVPATGLNWLAKKSQSLPSGQKTLTRFLFPACCSGIVVAAPLTYLFWYHGGMPDPRIVRFEQLCAGKVQPGSSGMVFVANESAASPPNSHIPEFLYAARLWGYGRVVQNEARAREHFEQWAPSFPGLEYVILYGTDLPTWLSPREFRLTGEDADHRLYIFRRIPHA